ncbi:hypothetical protein Q3G72_017920 [Acer saccharum]|nr:hypothetical protein Q3G72_017920 [Acer saccharum]
MEWRLDSGADTLIHLNIALPRDTIQEDRSVNQTRLLSRSSQSCWFDERSQQNTHALNTLILNRIPLRQSNSRRWSIQLGNCG